MHDRLEPKRNRFWYNVFMFYVDLDELDELAKKHWLISRNKFNLFSFRDRGHLQLPIDQPDATKRVKEHIVDYLAQKGVQYDGGKIMLLTNFNTLGYNFNPVSFYYVHNLAGEPLCAVVEVQNTFRELKPYFIGGEQFDGKKFHLNTTKYFYVSPFIDHDTNFDFNLRIPGQQLGIGIDDYKDGKRFFISTLTGERKELTSLRLLGYAFRFPLIPLQVMVLIHWQALKLWLKKLPFHKKTDHQELQRDIYRKK